MVYKGFMVMPFSNEGACHCYAYSLKPLFAEYGIDLVRADEIIGVDPIADDIVKAINQAMIVVVDISDNNPNVFYELGLAHAHKRQSTIVITGTTFESVPFDVRHIRIIKYENSIQGKVKFEGVVRKTLEQILRQPTFYEAEFSILLKLMEFSPGLRDDIVRSALVLQKIPGPLDHTVHVEYSWAIGEEKFRTKAMIFPHRLLWDGHVQAFALVEERNGAIYLTSKGEALSAFLSERGYRIESFELVAHEDRG